MKSIDSLLDRFCLNHPKLGIPNLMLYISIGNVVVLLLDMFSQYTFSFWLRLIPGAVFQGQIWRLVTFLFVPVNENLLWFVITVLLYYSIGTSLERTWGTTKFTVYYLLGAAMNLAVGLVMGLLGFAWMETANMYYLNMSLFLAYATLYPDAAFILYFIIRVKAKWLAWADGVFLALAVVGSLLDRNIPMALMPILAVLNYLLFFWSDLMELLNRGQRRVRHQTSRQTVNFKQATRRAQQQKGYIHKCAVCGKTDTEFPDEEFRYCSKCNGYYCYCTEHLSDHVHIK